MTAQKKNTWSSWNLTSPRGGLATASHQWWQSQALHSNLHVCQTCTTVKTEAAWLLANWRRQSSQETGSLISDCAQWKKAAHRSSLWAQGTAGASPCRLQLSQDHACSGHPDTWHPGFPHSCKKNALGTSICTGKQTKTHICTYNQNRKQSATCTATWRLWWSCFSWQYSSMLAKSASIFAVNWEKLALATCSANLMEQLRIWIMEAKRVAQKCRHWQLQPDRDITFPETDTPLPSCIVHQPPAESDVKCL